MFARWQQLPSRCSFNSRVANRGRSLTLAVLICVVVGGAGPGVAPAHAQTIPAYRIEAHLDVDGATVRARQAVRFRNGTGWPLDSVVFRAVPGSLGALTLGEVLVDGGRRPASLQGSVLEVSLGSPLAAGATVRIELEYAIAVPRGAGRLAASSRAIALGNWFPILAVHRGDWDRRQYVDVGDAFFSEVADYDVSLTTSRPVQVAATGRARSHGPTAWRFEARSVRDFAIAASPSWSVSQASAGGPLVTAYSFSQSKAEMLAERGATFVAWLGARYGAYPYEHLAIVDLDLPAGYGGMEYPGLVMLSAQIVSGSGLTGSSLDLLLGHEIAHQWFYSWVGNDQIDDPWLDEAFATYLPLLLYAEERPDLFRGILDGALSGAGSGPVDSGVAAFAADGPYYSTVYRKGAKFLHALREHLGPEGFDDLVRRFIWTYRDKVATPRAFLDAASISAPAGLNPLIAEYFSYAAFHYSTPQRWTLETPNGAWRDSAYVFVGAEFPLARLELWLDGRRLADGPENALTLSLSDVEAGEYIFLARAWNHEGVVFERAKRVEIQCRVPNAEC